MAIVFNPAVPIEANSPLTVTPRILKAQFGDGYEQRAADGLNYQVATATLTWMNLEYSEWAPIWSFFMSLNGMVPFLFTFPGDTQRLWVMDGGIKRTAVNGVISNLAVNIRQVFDIGI